jgi:citronellol/citronellal dehydrogenase
MIHTGAARAGVDNLTKTASVEWAGHGIRVNAVAPGAIWSSGTARYPREVMELAAQTQPIKRLGTVEEGDNKQKKPRFSISNELLCSCTRDFVFGF